MELYRQHPPARAGILLVAHGSKSSQAVALVRRASELLRRQVTDRNVGYAFLDHASPSPHDAVEHLVRAGVERIDIAPLLLLEADHWNRDVPALLHSLETTFANVSFLLLDSLGARRDLQRWSARQRLGAARSLRQRLAEDAALKLVMIVRGGNDARLDQRFEELIQGSSTTRPAFADSLCIQLTDPRWSQKLAQSVRSPCVIQTHLLFDGTLSDRVAREVESRSRGDQVELIRAIVTDATVESFVSELLVPMVT